MKLEKFNYIKGQKFVALFVYMFTALVALFSGAKGVSAQEIDTATVVVDDAVGNITSLETLLIFVANFCKYLGWAGVIIGVLAVIALLIYKLIAADDTETMKKVQGGITKAVVIVILGLLLLGAGLLLEMVSTLVGADNTSMQITTDAKL